MKKIIKSMRQFQENSSVSFHMEQAMALQRPSSPVASTALPKQLFFNEHLTKMKHLIK